MNIRFKVFASYNILQYLRDYTLVLIFVTVSKRQKSPKLSNLVINVNLHNITHSLVSRNPRERRFTIWISLLIATFLSLISHFFLSLMQTTKEVNPRPPRIAPCVNMWSVIFLFLLLLLFFWWCHSLNVGACICHVAREGRVEWTTPTEVRGEWMRVP